MHIPNHEAEVGGRMILSMWVAPQCIGRGCKAVAVASG